MALFSIVQCAHKPMRYLAIEVMLPALFLLGTAPGGETDLQKGPNTPSAAVDQRQVDRDLLAAVESGKADAIAELVGRGANPNLRAADDTPLLHVAAKRGWHEVVAALIQAGADINALDGEGNSPLHVAATICDMQKHFGLVMEDIRLIQANRLIVELLLRRNCEVGIRSKQGVTPLHIAAGGNEELVERLLQRKAPANVADQSGRTPLHRAAEVGRVKIIDLLLAAGARVNVKDAGGQTPLHGAAKTRSAEAVERLLAKGADVNAGAGGSKVTPLHLAARRGNVEVASCLLKHGANRGAQDHFGYTPLHYAVDALNREDLTKVLMDADNVKARSSNGVTALHMAASRGHDRAVLLLIQAGADVNAVASQSSWTRDGTPLDNALFGDREQAIRRATIKILVQHGAKTAAELEGRQ